MCWRGEDIVVEAPCFVFVIWTAMAMLQPCHAV